MRGFREVERRADGPEGVRLPEVRAPIRPAVGVTARSRSRPAAGAPRRNDAGAGNEVAGEAEVPLRSPSATIPVQSGDSGVTMGPVSPRFPDVVSVGWVCHKRDWSYHMIFKWLRCEPQM